MEESFVYQQDDAAPRQADCQNSLTDALIKHMQAIAARNQDHY